MADNLQDIKTAEELAAELARQVNEQQAGR